MSPGGYGAVLVGAGGTEGTAQAVRRASQLAAVLGVPLEVVAADDDPAAALLDTARRFPDALLCVTSEGMTGPPLERIGAVGNKVTHHAPGDVLLVAPGGPSRVNAMLVATDGYERATRALVRGLALAAVIGAPVTVVTVEQDRERGHRVLADAAEHARLAGVSVRMELRSGDPADEIVAAASAHDLVVVGNKGMRGAARFLLGGVTNKISHELACDLLIVKTA